MLDRKGILEIRKRFTKEDCTVTRLAGCYVNGEKEKIIKFNRNFLNMDDSELLKYLKILKKSVSGSIRKNLLGLEFEPESKASGGMQQFLLGIKEGELKNEDMLDILYDKIIETYEYAGNYIILIFHGTYDVMRKTEDNLALDESEDVFQYFICAICPVKLSKPGLGYNAQEDKFEPVEQDWVINDPAIAFMYPSFIDRTADVNYVTYYMKKPLETHPEVAAAIGCIMQKTSEEEKECLRKIIKSNCATSIDDTDRLVLKVQESIREQCDEDAEQSFSPEMITDVLQEHGVQDAQINRIKKDIADNMEQDVPLDALYDEKKLEKNKIQELREEIAELKKAPAAISDIYNEIINKLQEEFSSADLVYIKNVIKYIEAQKNE